MSRSYSLGNEGEQFVIDFLNDNNVKAGKNRDQEKLLFYDVVCELGGLNFTVEVKMDHMCQRTGNLAFEFYNSVKRSDSGIAATKADIWAHVIRDGNNLTLWLANVKKIKRFLKNNKPDRVVHEAGDGNASLYLYREDRVLGEVLERVETLSEGKFKRLLRKMVK